VLNEKVMADAKPDLIITQGLCEVCSPFNKELERAVDLLDAKPEVLVLNPHDLNGILGSIMQVASKVGRTKEGEKLVVSLQARIDAIKALVSGHRRRALCLEWLDPPFTAGHWVPEMIELAGGLNGLSSKGEHSRRMDLKEAIDFDPEVIFLMPCGFNVDRTVLELESLEENEKWNSLRAVRSGDVYALDSNSYFSKPGPRIITGLEILAKILTPSAKTKKEIKVPIGSYRKVPIASGRLRYKHRLVS
jgi:iron complex transport system substrate-binding protein